MDQSLASQEAIVRQLKANLHAAANRMKQLITLRDLAYNEGVLVFLKLHPYHQQSGFKRAY